MEDEVLNLGSAAIVCEHAAGGLPILMAARDNALAQEDSGWQFICNKCANENPDRAKIWLLREVIEKEPSLRDYLTLPIGSTVTRESVNTPWEVIQHT